ncbi:hypothetical protein BGZ96_008143 [Linnemannia gamsii]|uniref:Homeobox domain-containing protein n=1 Tax=Linnemannia gamsii TaxID=64522 RepID=A0ABQ7K097_9FUNG|nr:hypothetical protein BGZ96_008143 [Linnemannia gamsii]
MSNNTDQKDPHVSIAIASTQTSPTTSPTKAFKSLSHLTTHPDIVDSNTVQDDLHNTTTTTASLPALPQAALYLNPSHTGISSKPAARPQRRNSSSAFQEVDIANLSDPLIVTSFFTSRRHSSHYSSSTESGFVVESPTMDSQPYEFEMQRFNAYDGSKPAAVKVVTTIFPASTTTSTTSETTITTEAKASGNSFFTGWMTIPPSLAGRPKLSQDQEDYIRREYERGPVPLMWAKNDDIENQVASAPALDAAALSSWFGNWSFRRSSASSTASADTIDAPPSAAVAPSPSNSGRRETSQAR